MGSALSARRTRGGRASGADERAPKLDPAAVRAFTTRLRGWYRRHARDLPWRKTRDPYEVLVSELMLQQTQVSRVLEFYPRFLRRFPTLEAVAAARETQVLRAWEGLGYYARARNLHRLSRRVVREGARAWGDAADTPGAPTLPDDPAKLTRLPGIGAYTAGAVASFAHETRAALVDTNVARVLSRVFSPKLSPKRPAHLGRLWRIAEAILPRTGRATWVHNQALMELGALICTARVKRCASCPVRGVCRSREGSRASPTS